MISVKKKKKKRRKSSVRGKESFTQETSIGCPYKFEL